MRISSKGGSEISQEELNTSVASVADSMRMKEATLRMKEATKELCSDKMAVGLFVRINEVMEINIKDHTAKLNFSLGLMHRTPDLDGEDSPRPPLSSSSSRKTDPDITSVASGASTPISPLKDLPHTREALTPPRLAAGGESSESEAKKSVIYMHKIEVERRDVLEIDYPNSVGIPERVRDAFSDEIMSSNGKVTWKYSYQTMIGTFRIYPSTTKQNSYPFDSHDVFITGVLSYHNEKIKGAKFVEMTGEGGEINWEKWSWLKDAVDEGKTINGYIRSFEAIEEEWDIVSQKTLLTWNDDKKEPRFQLGFRINRKVKDSFLIFFLSNFLVTYAIFIVVFTTFGIALGEPGATSDHLDIISVSSAVSGRLQVIVTVMLALNTLRYSLMSVEAAAGTSSLLILYLNIAIFSCLLLTVVFGCYTSFDLALAAYDEKVFYASIIAWHIVCFAFFGQIWRDKKKSSASDTKEGFEKIIPTKNDDRNLRLKDKSSL